MQVKLRHLLTITTSVLFMDDYADFQAFLGVLKTLRGKKEVHTYELQSTIADCRSYLFDVLPWLADAARSKEESETWEVWLSRIEAEHDAVFEVEPIPEAQLLMLYYAYRKEADTRSFWSVEGRENLCRMNPPAALMDFLDGVAQENWPETATVCEYKLATLREISWREILDPLYAQLNQEYGYDENRPTSPDAAVIEKAEALAALIGDTFVPHRCSPTGRSVTVNVNRWHEKYRELTDESKDKRK